MFPRYGIFVMLLAFLFPVFEVLADDCSRAVSLLESATHGVRTAETAESQFREAVLLCPGLSDAHYNLGLVLLELGKPESALDSLQRASSLSKSALYRLALGNVLLSLERHDEAAKEYQEALQLDETSAAAYQGLSVVAEKLGALTEAEKHARSAIQLDPTNASHHFNYAALLERLDRSREALDEYRKATELDNDLVAAQIRLGILSQRFGDPSTAEKSLRTATLLDPKNVQAWVALARFYESVQNFGAAEQALRRARKAPDANAHVVVNYGIILYKAGKAKDSVLELEQATKAYPEFAGAHSALGWVYLQEERFSEAEKSLEQALLFDESNAFAHNNLGVLHELRGEEKRALESFRRAHLLAPELSEARTNIDRLSTQ